MIDTGISEFTDGLKRLVDLSFNKDQIKKIAHGDNHEENKESAVKQYTNYNPPMNNYANQNKNIYPLQTGSRSNKLYYLSAVSIISGLIVLWLSLSGRRIKNDY